MPTIPGTEEWTRYYSQAARDAARRPEWAVRDGYADTIERGELEMCAYFVARGEFAEAQRMLTRSLGQALMGNDGE